jgi:hypothetical protein
MVITVQQEAVSFRRTPRAKKRKGLRFLAGTVKTYAPIYFWTTL